MDSHNNSFESLNDTFKDVKKFFDKIYDYGFFQRLFAWKILKNESNELKIKLDDLSDDINNIQSNLKDFKKLEKVEEERDDLKEQVIGYQNTIEDKKKNLTDKMNNYDSMITRHEKRQDKKEEEEKDKHEQLEADRKVSWQTHESDVSAFIQSECMKYDIQYVGPQDFPDRKKPDNSILIDDRYIIFDAKSPRDSQDSASFIRDLTQKAKDQEKYTKMPNVKKDIYLVVPSNLYPDIKKRHYPLGKFEAWIITMEQISVILAHYKKTMDYEKFEGLSQDDKDALIREMGNLEFNLRYKIMVDSVFGKKFLEAIKSSKDNLPEEINDEIEKVITDSKDNVSRKDSGKPLSLDSIEREFNEANLLSQSRGIPTPPIEKKSEK